jgi:hypothetical protein
MLTALLSESTNTRNLTSSPTATGSPATETRSLVGAVKVEGADTLAVLVLMAVILSISTAAVATPALAAIMLQEVNQYMWEGVCCTHLHS